MARRRKVSIFYSGYYVCSTYGNDLKFERARFFNWIGRLAPDLKLIDRKNFVICPIDFLREPKRVTVEWARTRNRNEPSGD